MSLKATGDGKTPSPVALIIVDGHIYCEYDVRSTVDIGIIS